MVRFSLEFVKGPQLSERLRITFPYLVFIIPQGAKTVSFVLLQCQVGGIIQVLLAENLGEDV
jgi:hypothetical protein